MRLVRVDPVRNIYRRYMVGVQGTLLDAREGGVRVGQSAHVLRALADHPMRG